MASGVREIFSLGVVAGYVRLTELGFINTRKQGFCQGFCRGMNLSAEDGDNLFYFFSNDQNIANTIGFADGFHFATYTIPVIAILNEYLTGESPDDIEMLAVAVQSLLWSYSMNTTAITMTQLSYFIGRVLLEVAQAGNGKQVFSDAQDGIVVHPFSNRVIQELLTQDYYTIADEVAASPKTSQTSLVNYNWNDINKILSGPNLQIMKDIENQYYYIQGTLSYSRDVNLPTCIEDEIQINTFTGIVNSIYVRNTPCLSKDSYVGPPTGVSFKRIFNDGPSSSGDFNTQVKNYYISFDKHILPHTDWQSNAIKIRTGYLNNLQTLFDGTFIDANGRYDLTNEYVNAPDSYSCVGAYTRMHVGDNLPRYVDIAKTCIGVTKQNLTGFKSVSLEIDGTAWQQNLLYYRLNPVGATGNVLQRVLNLDANPYFATERDSFYYPFTITNPPYKELWYVGPPQLNGANTLPSLSFYHKMDSQTFGDKMEVFLYPSLSIAAGNLGTDTSRTFDISHHCLASGISSVNYSYKEPLETKVSFSQTIHSEDLTGSAVDEIYNKFFAMGDAFSGQFTFTATEEENAGYFYTGYHTYLSGIPIVLADIVSQYSNYVLGSPVKNFKWIQGWENPIQNITITKMMGYNDSGDSTQYYYVDNRLLSDDVAFTNFTWDWFAQLPTEIDDLHTRIYKEQLVENYLPRYSHGPYSIEDRKFLYPNAKTVDQQYVGKLNGFPQKLSFKIDIREETIKEIYCRYTISKLGELSNAKEIGVVRPNRNGNINLRAITPFMSEIFIPNDPSYNNDYDINEFPLSTGFKYSAPVNMVDNNWSPLYKGFVPIKKNNVTYDETYDSHGTALIDTRFKQGICITGNEATQHKIFTGDGLFLYGYSEKPMGIGLYHCYNSMSKNVDLEYVPPLFSLSNNQIQVSNPLLAAFPEMATFDGYALRHLNFTNDVITTGRDPFYYEFMGGRRGPTATGEGGYHSHNLIGDKWNGITYEYFGTRVFPCYGDGRTQYPNPYRVAEEDDRVIMFDVSPTGTILTTRAMAYTPFDIKQTIKPFVTNVNINYRWQYGTGTLNTSVDNGFLEFELSGFFVMKQGSGWYCPEGPLTIGPFDRDVLMGMRFPGYLDASSAIFVNDIQLNRMQYADNCRSSDVDKTIDFIRGTRVGLTWDSYDVEPFTPFAKIPSGGYAKFNIWNSPPEGWDLTTSGNGVGLVSEALISIVPEQLNWKSVYTADLHTGWQTFLNPYLYTKNGLETEYQINNSSLRELEGEHNYITISRSGIFYPVPNGDFTGLGTLDSLGNLIYPDDADVLSYWTSYAADNNVSVDLSGWREGSRISFTISNISESYDTIPYNGYRLVIPSGDCTISGEMGYYAQADNSIFSEGVHLINSTVGDVLKNLYDPQYVSEVINRVPIFSGPSGLILPAPSIMKQRQNVSGISDSQSYDNILSEAPHHYNKTLWPALSDLETLNKGETIEELPPEDGKTFPLSNLMFSAAQGQLLPNGNRNPNIIKKYSVKSQYQTYDSIATDALINSGFCLTAKRGTNIYLSQETMSGKLVPLGTSLSMITNGLA